MAHPSRLPVALFIWRFVPGGSEHQMIELARRLDPARFDVRVACFQRSGPWLRRLEGHVAEIAEFPIQGFLRTPALRQLRAFAAWCRRRRIAVVQSTDLYTNVFALTGAALAGVPVRIGSRREINPDKSAGLIALQRAAYSCAHRIVANSSAAADRLAAEGVRRGRIAVVPNGLDIAAYRPREPRGLLNRVITVANLRREKAHDVLLHAAAIVLRSRPEAEFVIAGDGVRLTELHTLADRLGIARRVRFTGHRDDVPQLLHEADIYVLPSRSEAMPNGVIEAMAAGMPVVATRVGGVPEVIAEGRTGLLVPPGDAAALSAAILELMAAPARASALGRAAREAARARFSFERMVNQFEQIYSGELAARAPVRAEARLLHS